MNKYAALTGYLQSLNSDRWKTNFPEIEGILGFSLPKSARHYQAWWANNIQGSRHTKAWLDAGWKTADVNFGAETLTFFRSHTLRPTREKPKPTAQISETDFHQWDAPNKMECRVIMEWRPLGKVTRDHQGRLAFPKAQAVPAIYRFRLRMPKGEALYIGETDNLSRRFGNYRNPGSTQQTSLRINAELKQALGKGAEISVSTVTDTRAWIDRGNGPEAVGLDSKVMRCLFENAAILDGAGVDIERLNRASSK